jgi:DNA recombination protein RmuC
MDMVIFLSVGLVVGAVIGVLLGKFVFASASGDAVTVAGLTATNNSMLDQIAELKTQIESMRETERLRLADESQILERLAPVHTLLNQVEVRVREMENERKTQFRSIDDQLKQARTDGEALRNVIVF